MTRAGLLERALTLTERDLALLEALAEHRFLTRRQIQTLHFHHHYDPARRAPAPTRTERKAQARLQLLRQHGLILRRYLTQPDGRREPAPYYSLTPAGIRVVSWRRQAEGRSALPPADALASPLYVRHALASADVCCALVTAARAHAKQGHACEPDWWQGERDARASFPDRGRQLTLAPDGYTRYRERNLLHHLFLELDRGTMTIARLQAKLDRYHAYQRSGAWHERYPVFPKLLVVTTSGRRRDAVLAAGRQHPELALLACLLDDFYAQGPLAPIWHRPNQPQPRHLLEVEAQ